MKDIFFGCSTQISRYAYLRHDILNYQNLKSEKLLKRAKILIFNKNEHGHGHGHDGNDRLRILFNNETNNIELIEIYKHKIIYDIIKKWLNFNEFMIPYIDKREIINWIDIDNDLKKMSIYWLGFDDNNITNNEIENNLKDEKIPIYAIDISKSNELKEYIENEILEKSNFTFIDNMKEILNLENKFATIYSYSKMFIDFLNKNNYCPSCGGHVISVDLGSRFYCLNDGIDKSIKCKVNLKSNNLQYPRTDPVVIISIFDENGRILLGNNNKRHPIINSKKFYSCFAGFMEPGETIEFACMREVYEETGLKIDCRDIKIIESQPWPFPANLMIGCLGILRSNQTNDDKININLDKELDDVRWFDSTIVNKVLNKEIKGVLNESNIEWYVPSVESVAGRLIERSVKECTKGKF